MITAPGSYVVTGNLTVPNGGGACITVSSGGVTLDLGGFTIDCASQEVSGVTDQTVNYEGVIIRNGKITRCSRAVFMGSRAVLVDRISTFANRAGINVGNSGGLVTRSNSRDNTGGNAVIGDGIFISCPGIASDNTALGNDQDNIETDQAGCILRNNLAP